MTGNRGRRVVYGTLAIGTGAIRLDLTDRWNQWTFRQHLLGIRATWRGWRIVLFLDRGSPHTAKDTRALARGLRIELRFLPTATPELNPVEGLWRYLKGRVLANEPTPDLDAALHRAFDDLRQMAPVERLRLAGVLSTNFWLST